MSRLNIGLYAQWRRQRSHAVQPCRDAPPRIRGFRAAQDPRWRKHGREVTSATLASPARSAFPPGDYRAGAVRSQRLVSSRSVSDALQSSPGGAWAYRLGGIELVIGQKNAPLAGAREALQSGWRDLNPRPPRPERGALPGCATPRRCTRCQHKAYGSGRRAEEYGTEERVVRVEAVKLPRSEDGSRGPWIGHDSFRNVRKLFSRSREWCVRCATSTVSSAHIMNARVIA